MRKHIIIPTGLNNTEKIMAKVNTYVSNINRLLKGVKSEILVDFIQSDNKRLLTTTNKVATTSNIDIVEKYIKDLNNIDSNDIMSPRLPQYKSYLKILGILYFVKDTNFPIFSDIVGIIIKSTHIFNDIVLVSWPHVIKTSLKSDIAVIWVNI